MTTLWLIVRCGVGCSGFTPHKYGPRSADCRAPIRQPKRMQDGDKCGGYAEVASRPICCGAHVRDGSASFRESWIFVQSSGYFLGCVGGHWALPFGAFCSGRQPWGYRHGKNVSVGGANCAFSRAGSGFGSMAGGLDTRVPRAEPSPGSSSAGLRSCFRGWTPLFGHLSTHGGWCSAPNDRNPSSHSMVARASGASMITIFAAARRAASFTKGARSRNLPWRYGHSRRRLRGLDRRAAHTGCPAKMPPAAQVGLPRHGLLPVRPNPQGWMNDDSRTITFVD